MHNFIFINKVSCSFLINFAAKIKNSNGSKKNKSTLCPQPYWASAYRRRTHSAL